MTRATEQRLATVDDANEIADIIRGLATSLAEDLIEFARERGYRRVRGRLPDGNEPALSFLSGIGAMVPLRNPDMTFELPL